MRTNVIKKYSKFLVAALLVTSLNACSFAGSAADQLNPFSDGSAASSLGERSTSSILGGGGGGGAGGKEAERACQALEVLGSYRRTQAPQPVYPVVKPAEVRLMWIPDHLNRHGDLVPAHYYYLRVLPDSWEVQDAFEIDGSLRGRLGHIDNPTFNQAAGGAAPTEPAAPSGGSGSFGTGSSGTSTPWVYKETK